MTDGNMPTAPVAIRGSGLCIPNETLASTLDFTAAGLDASILPAMVRRRTSIATRVAITAATRACAAAGADRSLPAIFVSSIGEIQVTDKLCVSVSRKQYPLSPTLFHNSVHNTAAGYWSMATGSMAAMQAMGALGDSFALGLLEAWCQLQTVTEQLLLVCYDESLPEQLLPDYDWDACAFALLLERNADGQPQLQRPYQTGMPDPARSDADFRASNPAMAALPLFRLLQQATAGTYQVALSADRQTWLADLLIP
jgi:hypothetical protein